VEARLRWLVSVAFALTLHVAAIAALLATTHRTPPPQSANDIEVALVDPTEKPDETAPAEPPPETPSLADQTPRPPDPPTVAEPPPPMAKPPDPPVAYTAPMPSPDPAPPPASPQSAAADEPPAPRDSSAAAPPSAPMSSAPPGFSIPTGPMQVPPQPEASPPPAIVAARPPAPATPPAAPPVAATRMAPLVVTAGAPHDPRLPAYPAEARARGEEGNVLVEIELDPGGVVRRARIKSSSGHASLDSAALRSAHALRFRPPRAPPGVVLRNTILVEVPFSFRLR
jgi:protein TonB